MAPCTPWQRMKFVEAFNIILEGKNKCKTDEPPDPCCYPNLTYYHNGKENICCKRPYEYNYLFCEGYDQSLHRDDRKHPFFYMQIDKEQEFPCRKVPLLTSSNYGLRPPIDPMGRFPRKKEIYTFYRHTGAPYCQNANGYQTLRLNPTWSFKPTEQFGYTYSPPRA